MRVNVLTEAGGHQGVTPVEVRALYLSCQPLKVATRELQDCQTNAVEPGRIRSHVVGQRKVGSASLGDQPADGLPAPRREESFDLLNDCWSEWRHDA